MRRRLKWVRLFVSNGFSGDRNRNFGKKTLHWTQKMEVNVGLKKLHLGQMGISIRGAVWRRHKKKKRKVLYFDGGERNKDPSCWRHPERPGVSFIRFCQPKSEMKFEYPSNLSLSLPPLSFFLSLSSVFYFCVLLFFKLKSIDFTRLDGIRAGGKWS